ncbi:MAG: fibronectin type III domain-containing protein [Pseudomonadota bacterium]
MIGWLDSNGKPATYVRLQNAPVTLGEKDQDGVIPTAEFKMPIKVFTDVESDSDSFRFPKEMLPALLNAPTNLSATSGNAQARLSWDAAAGASSYRLYWKVANGAEQLIEITAPPYTHTGLSNGTTYAYRVTAIDADGIEGASSQEVSAIPRAESQVTPGEVFHDTLQDGNSQSQSNPPYMYILNFQ